MSVLEIGAGIGDHSHYYMDRGCSITITEARSENLEYLNFRYPTSNIQFLNMETPSRIDGSPFELVHCYGVLHHLGNPGKALEFMARSTTKMMFLETCVSFGETEAVNLVKEPLSDPTQAYSGHGCRPTRRWVFKRLQGLFDYVYLPKTQPNHEDFPLDWTKPWKHERSAKNAVFIASRYRIANDLLTQLLLSEQLRHE